MKYRAGKNRFTIPIQLRDPGYYEYEATLQVPDDKDGWKQNNKAISFLHLEGEGRVLMIVDTDGDQRDWQSIQTALEETKRKVELRDAFDLPVDPLSLLPYDCVVFVNVRVMRLPRTNSPRCVTRFTTRARAL